MDDDIVTRLRNYWLDPIMNNHEVDICVDAANLLEEQQDEIERLRADNAHVRAALCRAVGELSTENRFRLYSPDDLLEEFLEESRRGRRTAP